MSSQVPSALKGLTSVFGMGTGGTPSPLPPEIVSCFGLDFQTLAQHAISCLQSSLRAYRIYTSFHPVPLANPDNCTSYSELSSLPGLSLNEAFDRLVSSSSTHCCASADDLSPGSPPGVLLLSDGSLILEVGFTLRCLQRLSHPHFASLLCRWHDNSCTSGASIPVLSY